MSLQLERYLHARAANQTVEQACDASGLGLSEAALWEESIERGEVELPKPSTKERKSMPKQDDTTPVETNDPLIDLASETLRGDVRDSLLSWFKAQPKSWPFMSEREQRDLADAADRFAEQMTKQACQIIASGERPCIVAKLVEYREKEGVEAKLKLPSKGEVVAALHEACGREVLIVTSGAEEFMGEAAPAQIDPQQRNLGIGDEYEEAA